MFLSKPLKSNLTRVYSILDTVDAPVNMMFPMVGVPMYLTAEPPLRLASSVPSRFILADEPPLIPMFALCTCKANKSRVLPPEASTDSEDAWPARVVLLPPESIRLHKPVSWSVPLISLPPDNVAENEV